MTWETAEQTYRSLAVVHVTSLLAYTNGADASDTFLRNFARFCGMNNSPEGTHMKSG